VSTPFDVLQVDPDADDETIKEAYKRRVKEAHPDHGGDTAEFQRVMDAYERLKAGYEPENGDAPAREPVDVQATANPRPGPGQTPGGADERPEEPVAATVEYLDYEVLVDRGWSLDDPDLFEKAAAADLTHTDTGRFLNPPRDSLLEAAEEQGFTWPYSCRGGACANCAVAVVEGDLEMSIDHVLPDHLVEQGIALSCIGSPVTSELKVVYNVKHMPDLEEYLLPPGPFEGAKLND
jgi:curved DNA-binding protein CbpA